MAYKPTRKQCHFCGQIRNLRSFFFDKEHAGVCDFCSKEGKRLKKQQAQDSLARHRRKLIATLGRKGCRCRDNMKHHIYYWTNREEILVRRRKRAALKRQSRI